VNTGQTAWQKQMGVLLVTSNFHPSFSSGFNIGESTTCRLTFFREQVAPQHVHAGGQPPRPRGQRQELADVVLAPRPASRTGRWSRPVARLRRDVVGKQARQVARRFATFRRRRWRERGDARGRFPAHASLGRPRAVRRRHGASEHFLHWCVK
jgi:hypothetical protein